MRSMKMGQATILREEKGDTKYFTARGGPAASSPTPTQRYTAIDHAL